MLDSMGSNARSWDKGLFGVTLILVVVGLVMIFSASSVIAGKRFGDSFFFFKQQLLWAILGFIAMGLAAYFPVRWWRKLVVPLTGLSLSLLILVLVPVIGIEVNGARRWLVMGPFSFQPSELAKLILIFYLGHYLVKHGGKIAEWRRGLASPLFLVGLFVLLVMLEPDLGGAVVMGLVAFSLLFIGGARIKHLVVLGIGMLPLLYFAIFTSPYRTERILTFLDPWGDPSNSGFQMVQSFLSLGSGGLFGVGLGAGRQKLFYLPESHTDFIFSVIGEEMGFVGALILVGCFLFLVWRGIRIALNIGDPFGKYLGFGITLLIGLQALMNMGVVTGLLPTKGLTLPFISYGGSSLMVSLTGVGILLGLSKQRGAFKGVRPYYVRRKVTKGLRA